MGDNPYRILGTILAFVGAILSPVFYFIVGSTPLTSVSLSMVILGLTSFVISNARPYLSPDAARILLKTGIENTTALLEELGLNNKAIYFPQNGTNPSKALIIFSNQEILNLKKFEQNIPKRLIFRFGPSTEETAIIIVTPGNMSLALLESKLGPTADEIQNALTYILCGVLDIARAVAVDVLDTKVKIVVKGPTLHYENNRYCHSLGSPIASIVAAISSEALGKPVQIEEEIEVKDNTRIILGIL